MEYTGLTLKAWEALHPEIVEREHQEEVGRRIFYERNLGDFVATRSNSILGQIGLAVLSLERNHIGISVAIHDGKVKGKAILDVDAIENPEFGIKLWGKLDLLAQFFYVRLFRQENRHPLIYQPKLVVSHVKSN